MENIQKCEAVTMENHKSTERSIRSSHLAWLQNLWIRTRLDWWPGAEGDVYACRQRSQVLGEVQLWERATSVGHSAFWHSGNRAALTSR